ncbi:MAG: hypothetical protein HY722_10170, partial [Planctomycetes bacterium]|nr:hypothetical protein [Planctomycetota bacterium]
EPAVVGRWAGGPHRLSLGPVAGSPGTFGAWLDGVPLGRVQVAGLDRTGTCEVAVHGGAPLGAAWRLEVHEVRLLRRIEEGGR